MPVTRVHTIFDCKHERDVDVDVDADVEIPSSVRGLGKCPACTGEEHTVAISGVAPKPGGKDVVLDSILMMPL